MGFEIHRYGDMDVWRHGFMEVERNRDTEVWKSGATNVRNY